LEFIHKRGYIHGDIKGSNVFVSQTKAVLGDFGEVRKSDRVIDDFNDLGIHAIEWFSNKATNYLTLKRLRNIIEQQNVIALWHLLNEIFINSDHRELMFNYFKIIWIENKEQPYDSIKSLFIS
jgi:serine/threonine protein kinase